MSNHETEDAQNVAGDAEVAPDRPAWLPEKFADAESLAKSYAELERKLSDLSERAKQAEQLEAELAQRDLLLQQAMSELQQSPELEAYSHTRELMDTQSAVNFAVTAAQAGRQQVREQAIQEVPGLAQALDAHRAETGNHLQEVEVLLNRDVPDWTQYAPYIQEAIARHQDLFGKADAPGKAQMIAAVVADAKSQRRSLEVRSRGQLSEEERARNFAAQTITGSGTRSGPSTQQDQAEWQKIVAAGLGTYTDLRRGS